MPRTLTATDRSALIRLAGTLDKGSPERKAILAGLGKKANAWPSGTLDLKSLGRKGLLQHAVDIVKRTRPFEIDNPEGSGKVTLTPKSTVTNTSFSDGMYTVYFGDSEIDGGYDYALTIDFQFGHRLGTLDWKMGNDY